MTETAFCPLSRSAGKVWARAVDDVMPPTPPFTLSAAKGLMIGIAAVEWMPPSRSMAARGQSLLAFAPKVSNLKRLIELPVCGIKIDQSMVTTD